MGTIFPQWPNDSPGVEKDKFYNLEITTATYLILYWNLFCFSLDE